MTRKKKQIQKRARSQPPRHLDVVLTEQRLGGGPGVRPGVPVQALWRILRIADLRRMTPHQEPQRPALQLAAEAIECTYNLAPPDPQWVKALETWHESAAPALSAALDPKPTDTKTSNGATRYRALLADQRKRALILLAQQAFECASDAKIARGPRDAARVALALLAFGWPADVPGAGHVFGLLEEVAAGADVGTRQRSFLRSVLRGDDRRDDARSERAIVRRARDLLSRAEADVKRSQEPAAPRPPAAPRRKPQPFEIGLVTGQKSLTIMLPNHPVPSILEYENGERIAAVAHDTGPGRIILSAAAGAKPPPASKDDRSRARRAVRRTCKSALELDVKATSATFSRPVTLSPRLERLVKREHQVRLAPPPT